MGLASLRLALLGSAVFALSTTASLAQSTKQNDNIFTVLQRLVVGAGSEKIAIDTPQAVTVVDQEDLDRTQAASLGDAIGDIPGVSTVGSDRVFGESFNIRGVGSLSASDESKIIVNVDGTPKFYEQYRMGSFFGDIELFKSVEVLRGPASSTLYGSGAFGGVINLTTKDASDFIKDGKTAALRVKGSYESNGAGRLASGIAAFRLNDAAEVLIAGNYRASDEFTDGGGLSISGSNFDAFSGLAKGTFYLDDAHEQIVRVSYQRWQSDATDQDYSQTGTLGFGKVDRAVTDQTATLSYENAASDNPWLDLNVSLSLSDTLNKQGVAQFFPATDYAYRSVQLKADNTIEFQGDSFENFLTFGVQAARLEREAEASNGAIGFHPEGIENKIGLFAQNEFIWQDKLTLIGGIRGDYVNQVPDSRITSANTVDDFSWSPKIAALYELNENISIFGSIAHTERMPTLDERFSSSSTQTASLNLKKEESNNYEIGAAFKAFDLLESGDTLSLKATGFYNEMTNQVERGTGASYYDNIGKSHIQGIEIESAYNSEYVFANLAYSMIWGENDVTGVELNSIPAHMLVASIGGRLPEYNLEAGWTSTFAAETTAGTSGGQPAYSLHGIYASWKPDAGPFEGTQARFSIDNIFDEDYQDNLAGDRGKGRSFKLSLSKQFDY